MCGFRKYPYCLKLPTFLKESMKLNWSFWRGGQVDKSMGNVWIHVCSRTIQYPFTYLDTINTELNSVTHVEFSLECSKWPVPRQVSFRWFCWFFVNDWNTKKTYLHLIKQNNMKSSLCQSVVFLICREGGCLGDLHDCAFCFAVFCSGLSTFVFPPPYPTPSFSILGEV